MEIHTARELGAVIRARRKQLGLSQVDLAASAGVGRRWLIELESGKSTVELRLVFHTLKALGLQLSLDEAPAPPTSEDGSGGIDLRRLLQDRTPPAPGP